jgi:hypothetical protein
MDDCIRQLENFEKKNPGLKKKKHKGYPRLALDEAINFH